MKKYQCYLDQRIQLMKSQDFLNIPLTVSYHNFTFLNQSVIGVVLSLYFYRHLILLISAPVDFYWATNKYYVQNIYETKC